jgi:hypothetical protein
MDRALGEVWDVFLSSLDGLGLDAEFRTDDGSTSGWDAVGSISGVDVSVELRAAPTVADVSALENPRDGAYLMVVARRLSSAVRAVLIERGIGFFDARGHLRLWRRPLLVDTTVPALGAATNGGVRLRFDVPSLLDVALAVLDGSVTVAGVRGTAALVGRSPSTVSKLLAALRAAHLVDARGEPTVPDLFDAVVDIWHPVRMPLADLPRPGSGPVNDRLRLGFDDPDGPGWVLADAFAAAAWAAPVVLGGDAAPDFYVPDAQSLRHARTLFGDAEFGRHKSTVAVAPAPFVCRHRYDRSQAFNNPFLAPSPVVAALDLAMDPARGRETLEVWSRQLPPGVRRVW